MPAPCRFSSLAGARCRCRRWWATCVFRRGGEVAPVARSLRATGGTSPVERTAETHSTRHDRASHVPADPKSLRRRSCAAAAMPETEPVTEAATGEAAVAAVVEHHRTLVIMDLHMPPGI